MSREFRYLGGRVGTAAGDNSTRPCACAACAASRGSVKKPLWSLTAEILAEVRREAGDGATSKNVHNRPGPPAQFPSRPVNSPFEDKSAIDTFLRGGPEPAAVPANRPAAPAPPPNTSDALAEAIRDYRQE